MLTDTPPARPGRPLRHRATVAILCVIALAATASCNLEISDRAEARDEWKRSYEVASNATLEIRNASGNITLHGGDGTAIDVTATRIVRAADDKAATEALAQFELEQSASKERVVLDTAFRNAGLTIGISRTAEFTVRLPRGVNVVVRSANGDVAISGMAGVVRANSTNGVITVRDVQSAAELETVNGSIDVQVVRMDDPGINIETTNGTVVLWLPPGLNGRLSVRTTNGSIDAGGLGTANRAASERRLDATIGGGGPVIRVETLNGSVKVRTK